MTVTNFYLLNFLFLSKNRLYETKVKIVTKTIISIELLGMGFRYTTDILNNQWESAYNQKSIFS